MVPLTAASKGISRARTFVALCVGAASILSFALTPVHAAGLAALIEGAVQEDPSVLEARAREEQAAMQTQVSRSGHWPVVGVQAQQEMDRKYRDLTNPDPVALTGKLNLFSGGAISSRIERDEYHEKFYQNKTAETRENLAMTMAQHYLGALRNMELLKAEQDNLQRHEKILADLGVIVKHDPGRNYELVQAQSRALQVRMRMVQYEKAMRLSLSKLTRYTSQPVTLANPFGADWRKAVHLQDARNGHPSVQAQVNTMNATRAELDNLRKSRWPSVDLVVAAGKEHRSTRVVLNWNFLDRGAYYSQQGAAKQLTAAQSRVDLLQREIDERSQTAEADMAQSQLQAAAASQQISASKQVVALYEMQFKIARRSLLDVLNAYAELANVEVSKVVADNDYRNAVASYLDANAAFGSWAQMAATGRVVPANAGAEAVPAVKPESPAAAKAASGKLAAKAGSAKKPVVPAAPKVVVDAPPPVVEAPLAQTEDTSVGVQAFAPTGRAPVRLEPQAETGRAVAQDAASEPFVPVVEQLAHTPEFRDVP